MCYMLSLRKMYIPDEDMNHVDIISVIKQQSECEKRKN